MNQDKLTFGSSLSFASQFELQGQYRKWPTDSAGLKEQRFDKALFRCKDENEQEYKSF